MLCSRLEGRRNALLPAAQKTSDRILLHGADTSA